MADAQDSCEQEVAAGDATRGQPCAPCSGNVIHVPYGASQHAPIDERDIAAVAVEALLTDRLLGQKGPLTGPRSQSAREFADTLAEALGGPIRFEDVPPEVARQAMLAQGFPEGFLTGYMLLKAEA
jgi:uncharacterized protein YbjT (DUF2867 family)